MSNADKASKVLPAVIVIVHNCDEGVGSTDRNLKSLLVNDELKNLLNAFEIAQGCCKVSLFAHIKEFLTGLLTNCFKYR